MPGAFSCRPSHDFQSVSYTHLLGTTVMITGGSVYVRVGNGTNYRAITTVNAGMTFDHVATARNGWNAIAVNGQVGWVSGKYSKVV